MNDRLPTPVPECAEPAPAEVRVPVTGRRVTSYDVALAAGVSQSAVSRCFKPGASVSKATFARVMQAAKALDYLPNAAARSLSSQRSGRSNLVAVVLSAQAQLHHPDVLFDLSQQFGQRGMRVLLFSLACEAELGATLAQIWQHGVDGAVVAARLSAQQADEFERRGIPVVLFNRTAADRPTSAVLCDQAEAARKLTTRLAAAGHRRFAIIKGAPDSSVAAERSGAVAVRLAELGLAPALEVDGGHDYAGGGRALREIVARLGSLPDAVVCANDLVAIGCLDTARVEMGLQVPRDLSIIGFDGIASASWLHVQLTTVRQPLARMTAAVAEMLGALIDDSSAAPRQRRFCADVIKGATARLGPVF